VNLSYVDTGLNSPEFRHFSFLEGCYYFIYKDSYFSCMNKHTIKRCPKCKSSDVTFYMGGQFGQYKCKKCDYVGALIIEEEIEKKK